MQYSKMKLSVGIFIIILFITVSSVLYFLLKEKGTFDKRYTYHFQTTSATSYKIGMPLKFSGFKIGVIDKIELKDDGNVFMTFSVNTKNRKWIAKESILMLRKPLIGSTYIEVISSIDNEVLNENATLKIIKSDDINDMISKLEPAVDKIIKIINSVDKITYYLARDDSEIKHTLQNIEKLSYKIANDDSLLTSITGDKSSTQNLINTINNTTKIMHDLQKISKDISKISSSLDDDIIQPTSSTIKELDLIMKDVKQKLDTLDSTVKTVGSFDKDLVELKEQISVGLVKSNQIMDKVDAIMQDKPKEEIKLP